MSFSGDSYAKWTMGQPTHNRMSLSLQFRTRQSSSVLMYATGQVDYSILAVSSIQVNYSFSPLVFTPVAFSLALSLCLCLSLFFVWACMCAFSLSLSLSLSLSPPPFPPFLPLFLSLCLSLVQKAKVRGLIEVCLGCVAPSLTLTIFKCY